MNQKLFTCGGLTVANCSAAKSVEKTIFSTINLPLYFLPKMTVVYAGTYFTDALYFIHSIYPSLIISPLLS